MRFSACIVRLTLRPDCAFPFFLHFHQIGHKVGYDKSVYAPLFSSMLFHIASNSDRLASGIFPQKLVFCKAPIMSKGSPSGFL